MVNALLCAAVLATTMPGGATNQIAQIEKRIGGRLGVAAIDLSSGRRIEFRPNERFPLCSTFKFLAVGAVLRRVDQGGEQLDRFVKYSGKDILAYAPVTKAHLSEGGMKLDALCEAALEQSDNTAANLLLQTIGGPARLTKFAREIGDAQTRLDRTEPELNNTTPGDERDTTTVAAMRDDWQKLLVGSVLSAASRARLESWLLNNTTVEGKIRAGVPANWQVGDKTGNCGNGALNDIAIYSEGASAPNDAHRRALAEVTKAVCDSR